MVSRGKLRLKSGTSGVSPMLKVDEMYREFLKVRGGEGDVSKTAIWENYHKVRINLGLLLARAVKRLMCMEGGVGVDIGDLKVLTNCFTDLQKSDPFYQWVVDQCKRDTRKTQPVRRRAKEELLDREARELTLESIVSSQLPNSESPGVVVVDSVSCRPLDGEEFSDSTDELIRDMVQED